MSTRKINRIAGLACLGIGCLLAGWWGLAELDRRHNDELRAPSITSNGSWHFNLDVSYASRFSKDTIVLDFKGMSMIAPADTDFDDLLAYVLQFFDADVTRPSKIVQFVRDGEVIATIHPIYMMVSKEMWEDGEIDDAKHNIGMCLVWPDGRRRTADQFMQAWSGATP